MYKTFVFLLSQIIFFNSLYSFTILVDPGHGGEDKGAQTTLLKSNVKGEKTYITIYEKNITLSISKIILNKLRKKNYKAYLTRSFDRGVSLEDRAKMSEKLNPDLFISVHINASTKSKSNGFEIFYLDNHSDVAVKKVEHAENKNLSGDELVVQQIIVDLVIERTVKSSKKLAGFLHKEFQRKIKKRFKIDDRGVKPGLFYVLALSKRPGVLLEVGFLSNQKELKKMLNKKFQIKFAEAIVRGIDRYMKTKIKSTPPLL